MERFLRDQYEMERFLRDQYEMERFLRDQYEMERFLRDQYEMERFLRDQYEMERFLRDQYEMERFLRDQYEMERFLRDQYEMERFLRDQYEMERFLRDQYEMERFLRDQYEMERFHVNMTKVCDLRQEENQRGRCEAAAEDAQTERRRRREEDEDEDEDTNKIDVFISHESKFDLLSLNIKNKQLLLPLHHSKKEKILIIKSQKVKLRRQGLVVLLSVVVSVVCFPVDFGLHACFTVRTVLMMTSASVSSCVISSSPPALEAFHNKNTFGSSMDNDCVPSG
ncbi:hypothetical protein F2P81_003415 [Scophthalmus maximus]|uniref:Uncharacterized protein n=1 Tax=Scophthalmus maximus TaxID=52904 RepID=A0A6A4TCN2_SCOMX|nr:hypothetical protein F2P81_003415 [Scophthalmus maximus]